MPVCRNDRAAAAITGLAEFLDMIHNVRGLVMLLVPNFKSRIRTHIDTSETYDYVTAFS